MKKIKQFGLKAMLLTIAAALTIGFTGCSDELSGDQTQGKPGYLTVNVKTLKPNQTKHPGDGTDDIQNIKNLNIFVVNDAGNVLVHRYYDYVTEANGTPWTDAPDAGVASIDIAVNELAADDYVVAVANYGSSITETTIDDIEALDITTVRDVTENGLHMTGRADIITGGTGYQSQVKIAPVESKITVNWTFGSELTGSYIVTGVYVVNAITHTKMPLIRNNTYDGTWDAVNIAPNGYINYTTNTAEPTRTAANGYTGGTLPTSYDFNRYATMSDDEASLLSDVNAAGLTGPFHYYLGENYSSGETALGAGALIANTAATHANTIVIIEATPTAAGEALYGDAVRYYTYEFDKNSTGTDPSAITSPNFATYTGITEGFSVRRKTNYNLTFNLNSIGSTTPFTRSRILSVTVTAEGWDPAGVTPSF